MGGTTWKGDERKKWTMRQKHQMLEKVKGIVIKLAWESWLQLPRQTKVWVQPDDLIGDCYLYVLQDVLNKYDGRAGYTTFLWWTIKNHLINLAQRHLAQKRLAITVPLGNGDSIVDTRPTCQDWCDAVNSIAWVYSKASPQLQVQMRAWFCYSLQRRTGKKVDFQEMAAEFRFLCENSHLHYDDCLMLIKSGFQVDPETRVEGL